MVEKQVKAATENARKHGVDKLVKFLKKDFTNTGFRDKSFEVVCAVESVCQTDDKEAFLRESYRLLRKNGRIIIADAFKCKKALNKIDQQLLKEGCTGWAVNDFSNVQEFKASTQKVGFRNIIVSDETLRIMPSSMILYRMSLLSYPIVKIFGLLKMRTKTQQKNHRSAYLQYKALKKHIVQYCILSAEKK